MSTPMLLVSEETRRCPFCDPSCRLRLHGTYVRFLILPGEDGERRIRVARLLCPTTGRTVSLLPDFCVPGRQHGTVVLARFLDAYSRGASLQSALRAARHGAERHSTAQSLRSGFLSRAGPIRDYVAKIRRRVDEAARAPKPELDSIRRETASLIVSLIGGLQDVAEAFVVHGVGLFCAFGVALA
jgi:hypothetical protein